MEEQLSIEENFVKFTPLIKSTARKFSNIYGVEYEELINEGNLIFTECSLSFSPKKACFYTYLSNTLNGKLNIFAKKYESNGAINNFPENILYNTAHWHDNYSELIELNDSLNQMSDLAKYIIELIYHPEEIMKLKNEKYNKSVWEKKVTKKAIEKFLMSIRNYTRSSIRTAFTEINQAIEV